MWLAESRQSISHATHTHTHTSFERGFYFHRLISDIRANTMTIMLTELAYWQFSKLNVIFAHQIMFALTLVLQPFEKRQIRNNEVENHLIHNVQKAKKETEREKKMAIGLCYFTDKNLNWNENVNGKKGGKNDVWIIIIMKHCIEWFVVFFSFICS